MPSHTSHTEDMNEAQGHRRQAAAAAAAGGVPSPSQDRTKTKFKVSFPKDPDDPELAKQIGELNDERRRLIRQKLHDISDNIDDNQVRHLELVTFDKDAREERTYTG